ncbi:ABC transporter permease subunit [Saccharothrix yanglingensis]|uniref:ABC-2 family transporter n=1 Tax=Saccharothrix yanglingensis TaxID=659496 RepID=A0ABU0X4U7_9PSEU|nr:ABC transporter permease subunit [Saccharothrix yanglingensis]MDQ2587140.1 hypothetical protein [Saccharothrix yanglingensis]
MTTDVTGADMTDATATGTTAAAPPVTRSAVGWRDLAWLTWRQHRGGIGACALVVAGAACLALALAAHITASGHSRHELFGVFDYPDLAQVLTLTPLLLGPVVAGFWTAPLLAREYEQRTHLVVWSQDVSAVRWLTGKVVLLGVLAVALAAGLGSSLVVLMDSVNATSVDYAPFRPFESQAFEAAPHVQAAYAAFAFALGLALSALTRRTVVSMGLALVGFAFARFFVAVGWRPHYREPERVLEPYAADGLLHSRMLDDDSWVVDSGYADAAGDEVDFPRYCVPTGQDVDPAYTRCVTDSGVAQHYADYQPGDRAAAFQWVESAVFAVPAAALLVLVFVWVRRSHRV